METHFAHLRGSFPYGFMATGHKHWKHSQLYCVKIAEIPLLFCEYCDSVLPLDGTKFYTQAFKPLSRVNLKPDNVHSLGHSKCY